ncbi:MAG: hypothetical protein K0S79_2606 [Nitrospira sp.]|jgi:hypothetical protein|nr:hypothetical protein [Nitrospira sp.]
MFKRYILTAQPWRLVSPTRPTDCFAIEFPGRAFWGVQDRSKNLSKEHDRD